MKQDIKVFDKVIMRNPTKTLGWFFSNMKNNDINGFLEDPTFRQAIFLASPILYNEINKYKNCKLPAKEAKRFEISVLKYASRMCSRCTPFGLFSSVSIGKITNKNDFKYSLLRKLTKLDMSILYLIFQKVDGDEDVKKKLKYYPNTSLYQDRGHLYYTQEIFKGEFKKHTLFTINSSNYVKKILIFANQGVTNKGLVSFIISEGYTRKDAQDFVDDLINNQVLISELYPYLTGEDYLHYLNSVLRKYQIVKYTKELSKIEEILVQISLSNNNKNQYDEIFSILDTLSLNDNKDHRLQCDTYNQFESFSLNNSYITKVVEVIKFLNKITPKFISPDMKEFIQKFMNRYEGDERPFLQVIDEKTGIGYKKIPKVDYLLSGLKFEREKTDQVIGHYECILLKKYMDAIKDEKIIVLNDEDFLILDNNLDDLPDTFSAFFEVLDGKILFQSAGFASATSLLGRFGYLKEIEDFLYHISSFEAKKNSNEVLAEVVHIPMSRVGNVLHRPMIREYEIPYMCNSHAKKILLSDLMVSVKGNDIRLRSRKLNKFIRPMMATAHNHSSEGNLPIYSFLCGLQNHNKKVNLMFSWGGIDNIFNYYPRVEYKGVVLSLAKWKVTIEELNPIFKQNLKTRIENFRIWKEKRNIPNYVQISSGDNKLFLDLDIELCMEVMLSELKKMKTFYLQEYPRINQTSIVRSNKEFYNNQFILSLYKYNEKDRKVI